MQGGERQSKGNIEKARRTREDEATKRAASLVAVAGKQKYARAFRG